MKRLLFIIVGLIFILLLVGVWAYFLFFGTPNPPEGEGIFSNFNFGNTTDPTVTIPEVIETEDQLITDVASPESLRQLTTTPVAGYQEVLSDGDVRSVRYIEAGTGHIFSIDLVSGLTERVSATTIPLATKGVMTKDGQYALILSNSGAQADFIVGEIIPENETLRNFALPDYATSFAVTDSDEFVYTTPNGSELIAKAYNPDTNELRTLFTIPFREATIRWNNTTAGPHVVYPHASSRLEGYVYTYTNGQVTRQAASGYGLSAVGSEDKLLYSAQFDNEYTTIIQDMGTFKAVASPLTVVPEKCSFITVDPTIAVCGITLTEYSHLMPDVWYQGNMIMNDTLWEMDTQTESATLLVNPESATGRQLDIVGLQFSTNDRNLYFQNKLDQTLWVYEYLPTIESIITDSE